MDDYTIKVKLPGYEKFHQKLIDIENKTIELKLRQSMLKLKFVNLENTLYEPGFILMENKYSKVEKYSSAELKQGISVYDIEFPAKLFSPKNSISIFDKKGNAIDTLIIDNAGFFDFIFKENVREFPAVFYDLSEGKTAPDIFENWINEKKTKSDGIFLYVTNGYEKVYNSNPDNIISVANKIYRIVPRTSNVLESISEFEKSFESFARDVNLNDEEAYGTKMKPRFYLFLSDENVERLEFAVNKFVEKIEEMEIERDRIVVFINAAQKNSSIIKQLKNNNFSVQII
jgi:hypothetical protein